MEQTGLNRRAFLERSGQATAGAAVVVATGSVTMLMAPDGAWAASLEVIAPHDAQVILRALRVMYPHDALGDQYYARVVAALDDDAKADPEVGALLKEGAGTLDGAMPVPFLDLSPGHQHQILAAMEDSDFFSALRGKTIVALYNDERVWQAFGYEGSSYEHGGYLERGFDDLGWLPDPPPEASPPMEL